MNLNALSLLSSHPIDKIVQSGSGSVNHAGAVPYTGGNVVNYPDIRKVEAWVDHNYGRAMLVRAVFSVDDGVSWQEASNVLQFGYTFSYRENGVPVPSGDFEEAGPRMHLAVGCDDSRIRFLLQSNYITYSTLVFNLNTTTLISTISGWTAAPQTVLIKYWAYERG